MVNIGTDRRCLARHGEIIRHNNNYPPTPGPHSMKTDSDGQADLALRTPNTSIGSSSSVLRLVQPSGQHAPLPLGYELTGDSVMPIPVSQTCRPPLVRRPRHHAPFHAVRAVMPRFVHKSVHKRRTSALTGRMICGGQSDGRTPIAFEHHMHDLFVPHDTTSGFGDDDGV